MKGTYRVERNNEVGRYVIAARDLQAGSEVLTEIPFSVGPKSQSSPVCLGCYALVDGSMLCSKCKWPVCDSDCEEQPLHKNGECIIFVSANVQYQQDEDPSKPSPQYECVTPLRTLLAKESDPNRWDQEVKVMEAHMIERKESPDWWDSEQVNVVDFIRDRCKLADKFDSELIHRVCGILEVNCFEIKTPNGVFIRGLYPNLALLSHNCIANTTHSIFLSENYKVQLRTTVDVMEGSELFTSYTSSILPTFIRRENLKYSKYFDCTCPRCSDPTELGTYLSCLKCTKCDNGIILSSNPLDPDAYWKCTLCEFTLRAAVLRRIYAIIQCEINRLDNLESSGQVIEETEKLLKQYKSVLHPQNAFNTTLRHNLIQLYGRAAGYTFELLPDILLERKIELCSQILKVVDVLKPGMNRFRAMILYELHVPLMLFARNRYQYGELDKQTFKEKMIDVANVLAEAVSTLIMEDPDSPEGSVGQIGANSLEQLRESINQL